MKTIKEYTKQVLFTLIIVALQIFAISACMMDQSIAYKAIAGVERGAK